ncbi:dUTP diphosphatase [Paenibacillus rhizophilus]|uniref:dUTPase n=1 Tax=Paenibacillus rhizophilus TaxID=1850366 RepID=A0A3N9P2E6_9BACL|nr:dUTP diphosphatase [Paenibacillus rhizophilus]RQW10391.1 hypothetical protein EH198_16375 [Paenibacillus rhizophilus]
MNLTKLFEMQNELDDYIVKTKGLEGQGLLPQKILALQVELGECANEWRGFKYWSEDKEQNTDVKRAKGYNWTKPEYLHRPVDSFENPLLEEYVDCLHFILSIGLELEPNITEEWELPNSFRAEYSENQTEAFNLLFGAYNGIENREEIAKYECYIWSLEIFFELGEMLGFTWDQIESAYRTKWEINKQRQVSGY